MSSREYKVAIKLVDGGVLQKIESLGKNSPTMGGLGSGLASSLGQLAKLGLIATGIGSLVALATKSSGILQGTFKIWETAMSLVFKPFADFIGLILRPIAIALLQFFVIPFYQKVYPFFREWGTKIGQFFADPAKALETFGLALAGAIALAIATKWPVGTGAGGTPPAPQPSSPGGGNPAPSMGSRCLEICEKSVAKFTKPVGDGVSQGIGQSVQVGTLVANTAFLLTMNSSLQDMKGDIRTLRQSMENLVNRFPTANAAGGKNYSVSLSDSLTASDKMGISTGIASDWGAVAASGAAAAVAAGVIEGALVRAAGAISSAAGKLEGLAQGIPNSTAFGFGHFGPGGEILPSAARTNTRMAGIADTVRA